jgi:hypothetical protein
MDRHPRKPPFAPATQVRYVGTRRLTAVDKDGNEVPLLGAGLVVTVSKTTLGRRGTLRPLPGEWDDDEPPLDTTQDGYSVYEVEVPGYGKQGRIIWPENAVEWECI